jgi:hypothetical protein
VFGGDGWICSDHREISDAGNSVGIEVMAQRNYFRTSQTGLSPSGAQGTGDVLETAGSGVDNLTMTTTVGGLVIPATVLDVPRIHQTRRVAVDTALSGSIDLRHWSYATAGSNATIRVQLSTITLGGSDVESVLGVADEDALPTAAGTLQTLTIPIVTTTLPAYQRIIVRVFAVPLPSQTMGAGTVTFPYNAAAASTGDTSLELPDGMTWFVNRLATILRCNRTAVNAIGNFFDLTEALGPDAGTTAVVDTVASGTEIQWTRTAGGTVLEWITPPFRFGWQYANSSPPSVSCVGWGQESATAANCTIRYKLFRRRGIVETQCFTGSHTVEFTTSAAPKTVASTIGNTYTLTAMDFQPDDRMVCRFYIIPVGVMGGSRTCTLTYDSNLTTGGLGACQITLTPFELFFKAETDAPEAPTGGLSMSGMGN